MKRIILLLAVTALLVLALAVPAIADPGNAFGHSQSQCNAGIGNGAEGFVDCDPAESADHNQAGKNSFRE